MQQLSGLDAAFLALESSSMFGHVGSLCIVDPATAAEPVTLERLTRLVASRLPLVPPFRRRLVEVPLGLDMPYWIDDPDFDIEFHVRELALPAPGNDQQLREQAARLHARPLDRARPLWELYLISGLAGGRIAIYTKVHHAAIDGVSGNDILGALLDVSPEGRDMPFVEWPHESEPGNLNLLARSVLSLARQPVRATRLSLELLRSAPSVLRSTARPRLPFIDRDASAVLSRPSLRAPKTPFNAPITPHRRFAFCQLSLGDIKKVKNAAGMTVNDVVMALSTGALRRWLEDHDALPDSPLVAAVPISIRTPEQAGTAGNQISGLVAALPTQLASPLDRLQVVHESMRAAKEQHGALPADLLVDVTQFAIPALAGQAARLNERLRLLERANPFNLFVSNVPGPNVPLYFAGAELQAYYPLSAIADGQGLNITVISYRDSMFFGLIACRELVPDLDVMADYVQQELATLLVATASAPPMRPQKARRTAERTPARNESRR
ncbi:MAG TPA: wax ester/triacylglycerol synthase family O-acyltransferase [Frankiaceae bacterium]|jgi:WS/DGAT/MGAT family acyltransferase|nr:wax ester/triacylglycerol synthase family O-acyltransferase [Frankiaceae bacterium]